MVGPNNTTEDISPVKGEAVLLADKEDGLITMEVLADSSPELNEMFTVSLIGVRGGAEIHQSSKYNTSLFSIRYVTFL